MMQRPCEQLARESTEVVELSAPCGPFIVPSAEPDNSPVRAEACEQTTKRSSSLQDEFAELRKLSAKELRAWLIQREVKS